MKQLFRKIDHFFLNTMAWLVLEPLFRSGRWQITDRAKATLKPYLESLMVAYDGGQIFFNKVDMCRTCPTVCCSGNFNRFTVYDRITHQLMGVQPTPEYRYRLRPVGSYKLNVVETGICSNFVPGKGCGLPYRNRPAMCNWWICGKMKTAFDSRRHTQVRTIRDEVDRVQRAYVWTLLLGGMKRTARTNEGERSHERTTN